MSSKIGSEGNDYIPPEKPASPPPKKRTREEVLGSHINKPLPPLPSQKPAPSPPPLSNVSSSNPPPPSTEVKEVAEEIFIPEKKARKKRFFKTISSLLTPLKNKRKPTAKQPSANLTAKVTKEKKPFLSFLRKNRTEKKETRDFLRSLNTIEIKLKQAPDDRLLRELIDFGSSKLKVLSANPILRARYESLLVTQLDQNISSQMDVLQELTVPQSIALLKFAALSPDECKRLLDIRQDLKHADFDQTRKYLAMLKELNEMKELTADLSSVVNTLKQQLVTGLKEDKRTLRNLQLSAQKFAPRIEKPEKFNQTIAEILSSEIAFLDRMKYLTTPQVTIIDEKTKKEKQVTFAQAFEQAGIINSNEALLISNTFEEIVRSSEQLVEKLRDPKPPSPPLTDQEKLTKLIEVFGSNEFKEHLAAIGAGVLKQKEIKAIFLKITQNEKGKQMIAGFDPELAKKMRGMPDNPFQGVIADPFQRLGRYGILLKAVESGGAAKAQPTLAQEGLGFLAKLVESWTAEIEDKLT